MMNAMRWPEGDKRTPLKTGRPVKFSIGCNGVALDTALRDKISATAANACDEQRSRHCMVTLQKVMNSNLNHRLAKLNFTPKTIPARC